MNIKFKNARMEFEINGEFQEVKNTFDLIKSLSSQSKETIVDEVSNQFIEGESLPEITNEKQSKNYKAKNSKVKSVNGKPSKTSKPKIVALNIPDERNFIEDFKTYKGVKSITQKVYVLVSLLKKHTNVDIVNIDIVHSLLHLARIDTPKSIGQMLVNFVNQDKTFDRTDEGNFKIKFQTLDLVESLKNEIIKKQ